MDPLPATREERVLLLQTDPSEYIRRMGAVEIDRLLKGLARTDGLTPEERTEIRQERYNVPLQYLPERYRRDH